MKDGNTSADYSQEYTEKKLFEKILEFAKKAGMQLVYMVLIGYFLLQSPDVPKKDKAIIIGALGYFIMPLDLIPDLMPMGFADDLGALALALANVSFYINEDVKNKAKQKLKDIFGEIDEKELGQYA
jgi:uncharacterized membrane protein YkvA (DUF1232 family)